MVVKKTSVTTTSSARIRLARTVVGSAEVRQSESGDILLVIEGRNVTGGDIDTYQTTLSGKEIRSILRSLSKIDDHKAVEKLLEDSVRDLVRLTAIASGVAVQG